MLRDLVEWYFVEDHRLQYLLLAFRQIGLNDLPQDGPDF
jgi:hypothetical protein